MQDENKTHQGTQTPNEQKPTSENQPSSQQTPNPNKTPGEGQTEQYNQDIERDPLDDIE
jgi:hypothetical protein